MLVGTTKEVKTHEYRVGLEPVSVRELVHHGHGVVVESGCGAGIGFDDEAYRRAGAEVVDTPAEVFARAEMVVKVKEPQPAEMAMLREGQVLFTYLHLAADAALAKGMMESGCIGIAYETVTDGDGRLPLLAPMSEVAGRMAIQVAAHYLEKEPGGAGILLGGVAGVPSGKVTVVGGGVSGSNAARMAVGLEARVTVLDLSLQRLGELDTRFGGRVNTVFSTVQSIEEHVRDADVVVGAVLVPGAAAPKLVREETVKAMRPGSVVVDIAIDQGGCLETSRPTTHADPVYQRHGVVHYCVTNMPGAVARTSTMALNNATLPYVVMLANEGYRRALAEDPGLRAGLNIHAGRLTYRAVARDLGLVYTPAEEALRL